MLVVNKRLRPTAVLVLVRRRARQQGCRVVEMPARGKGSHRLYVVLGLDDGEMGRFAIPDHARELSWTVLRSIEQALTPALGDRWMEEK